MFKVLKNLIRYLKGKCVHLGHEIFEVDMKFFLKKCWISIFTKHSHKIYIRRKTF